MKDFRIGDKVILTGGYNGAEGEVVGVDLNKRCKNKYLVKSGVINEECGWNYEETKRNFDDGHDIKPYEGYAIWTDDIEKIEEAEDYEFKDEMVLNQCNCGEECMIAEADGNEEYIRTEFDKIREQKKETIKEMSEKVLGLTLEIKEIEAEIEKIKKDWHID